MGAIWPYCLDDQKMTQAQWDAYIRSMGEDPAKYPPWSGVLKDESSRDDGGLDLGDAVTVAISSFD